MAARSELRDGLAATVWFDLPGGIRIAADAFGDPAAQPVLFLHGGGQTRHAWGGTAAALGTAGYFALTMDMRGHGDSSWDPAGRYDLEAFVSDLQGVVTELSTRPVLVGASLGGIAALTAETEKPRSVAKGLVLVDVTPRMERNGVLRIFDFMKGSSDGFASLEDAADAVASYLPHRRRPKDLRGLAKNLRETGDGRYRWHWDPKILSTWDPEGYSEEEGKRIVEERIESARRLEIPTLLVRGQMSDVVTEEQAREFLELVPHAEYVDLAGAAHMVAGDKNDAFTQAVFEFIRRRFDPSGLADANR